jgi:hypothetical protein
LHFLSFFRLFLGFRHKKTKQRNNLKKEKCHTLLDSRETQVLETCKKLNVSRIVRPQDQELELQEGVAAQNQEHSSVRHDLDEPKNRKWVGSEKEVKKTRKRERRKTNLNVSRTINELSSSRGDSDLMSFKVQVQCYLFHDFVDFWDICMNRLWQGGRTVLVFWSGGTQRRIQG